MSLTLGTLCTLILCSLLCLNISGFTKGVIQSEIEANAPYDACIFDDREFFPAYRNIISEDYTIQEYIEYDVYKEPNRQIQNYLNIQFYDFDPVIKLSDYNKLLRKCPYGKYDPSEKENERNRHCTSARKHTWKGPEALNFTAFLNFFAFLEEKILEVLFQIIYALLVIFLLYIYGVDLQFIFLPGFLFAAVQCTFQKIIL